MFCRNKDFNFNNYVSCKSRFVKLYGYKILNITFLSLSLSLDLFLLTNTKRKQYYYPDWKSPLRISNARKKSTRSDILFQEVTFHFRKLLKISSPFSSLKFIAINLTNVSNREAFSNSKIIPLQMNSQKKIFLSQTLKSNVPSS